MATVPRREGFEGGQTSGLKAGKKTAHCAKACSQWQPYPAGKGLRAAKRPDCKPLNQSPCAQACRKNGDKPSPQWPRQSQCKGSGKLHAYGDPRRRPCLGVGRGRRTREAMCRQRAGCNAGTLTARNLVPPVEGFRRFKRLKAGKRQARMP